MATNNTEPPKGMRDFLPTEVALRDWASSVIQNTYSNFGFSRIETPIMENIQNLRGAEGGENLALIFEVLKRGEKLDKVLEEKQVSAKELSDLGLRFDLTVPLVRYYSANQSNLPNPLKAIQIGSVFRAESPQKGRFRQFTQCDIDIIGIKSEIAEMELISATTAAFLGLGFKNFVVHINDRRFLSALAEHCGFTQDKLAPVFIALDKLDKIGLEKVSEELKGLTHNPEAAAKLTDYLTAYETKQKEGKFDFAEMKAIFHELCETDYMRTLQEIISGVESISEARFSIRFDPTLVRGMGYYTGPIFEVKNPGYSGSIAGGGRYDSLVGKISGRDVPACGFSIGFERVIDILMERGFQPPCDAKKIVLIIDPDKDNASDILKAANKLRNGGNLVTVQPRKKDLKKQLDSLFEQGYTQYCAYKGDKNNLYLKAMSKTN